MMFLKYVVLFIKKINEVFWAALKNYRDIKYPYIGICKGILIRESWRR